MDEAAARIRASQNTSPWYQEFLAHAEAEAAEADSCPGRPAFGDMVQCEIPENMINALAIIVRQHARAGLDSLGNKFATAALGYLARGIKKN